MTREELYNLKIRLDSLAVFRGVLEDGTLSALRRYLKHPTVNRYAVFVSRLYETGAASLGEHVQALCEGGENVYLRALGRGETPPPLMERQVWEELDILQTVAELSPAALREGLDWEGPLPEFSAGSVLLPAGYACRIEHIGTLGYGIYARHGMFCVDENDSILPVQHPDPIRLKDLVDYASQRQRLLDNTLALLAGKPAANVLLTGDAGTGKSSTVKATGNEFFDRGLRIVELKRNQLRAIPKLLDALAGNPLKFILFIDDLSFARDDDNFNTLKAALEGSVSAKSPNVAIYATSNRRHIVKETFSAREGDDIHRNDAMQELGSLADRFGLHITFQKPDKAAYLRIVGHLARESGLDLPREELEAGAERFALERGGRSARLARQYVEGLLSGVLSRHEPERQ